MTVRVGLTPEAEADVEEIHAWYAERGAGLGDEFRSALGQCIDGLANFPESHVLIHRSIRRAVLHRFPYCVFYVVEEERVVIHGCFHAHRDPNAWRRRMAAG